MTLQRERAVGTARVENSTCQYTSKLATLQELSNYITNYRLSDALELLEQRGITDELALFVLANLQVGGAA
jgi:hypothetical protein